MTDKKVFYEIELPKKTTYAIVVFTISDKAECQHCEPFFNKAGERIGQLLCDSDIGEEVYECTSCGMWACDSHLSKQTFHGEYVCKICAKLPPGIIEEIIKLRESINN